MQRPFVKVLSGRPACMRGTFSSNLK